MKSKKIGEVTRREKYEVFLEVMKDRQYCWIIEYQGAGGKWFFMEFGGWTRSEAREKMVKVKQILSKVEIKLRTSKYVPYDLFLKKLIQISEAGNLGVGSCSNWNQAYATRGYHCYNCNLRDGYPQYGRPDKNCANWRHTFR